jgi:hypothetical protein
MVALPIRFQAFPDWPLKASQRFVMPGSRRISKNFRIMRCLQAVMRRIKIEQPSD